MNKIKVMVVDDQPIVRDGLKLLLSLSDEIDVLCTASNGEEAVKLCEWHEPDIILMDIRMPGMDGVKATKIIKERYPKVKVIVLTTFNDDSFIFEALKNGASSYLLKDVESEELINTIKIIHLGGTMLQNSVATKLVNKISKLNDKKSAIENLTQRELEISKLVAEGLSNKEIASKLFITEGTVKNHISNILSKLGLSHRTQIALYIIENYHD
ncbi:MAG TPA: response regulator transcription factor [Acetivibrio sp.]|mgnify:FL=1|nr:response regulator transcription factor [Acetivibrio sp.]HPT91085.1 response regulator transcription factor [Acetivibrio sp.]